MWPWDTINHGAYAISTDADNYCPSLEQGELGKPIKRGEIVELWSDGRAVRMGKEGGMHEFEMREEDFGEEYRWCVFLVNEGDEVEIVR
jgi:hypothetical protein